VPRPRTARKSNEKACRRYSQPSLARLSSMLSGGLVASPNPKPALKGMDAHTREPHVPATRWRQTSSRTERKWLGERWCVPRSKRRLRLAKPLTVPRLRAPNRPAWMTSLSLLARVQSAGHPGASPAATLRHRSAQRWSVGRSAAGVHLAADQGRPASVSCAEPNCDALPARLWICVQPLILGDRSCGLRSRNPRMTVLGDEAPRCGR
jgi:hypothetical protein